MNVLVAVFTSSILAALATKECNPHFDACDKIGDITTILCSDDKCHLEEENQDLDYLVEGLTTLDADTCRMKCKEQKDEVDDNAANATEKCQFFRFEMGHSLDTRCSLQTECGEGDQYCGKPYCVSGELGCDDEGNEIQDCSLTSPTEWNSNKFHVICTDVHYGDVNIYSQDTAGNPIPGGTVCSTVRMCSAWDSQTEDETYYRKLAVMCNGKTGEWVARDDTGSKEESGKMVEEQGKIAEPECPVRCEELELTKYAEQSWADLICDFPLTDGNKLVDTEEDGTNSCILLCDNHLQMSIDCGFIGEGEKHWHDIHGTELKDETIICPE